jgi:PPOX class probable F420-dependent enzyme
MPPRIVSVMSDPAPSRRLVGDEVLDDPLVRELLDGRLVGVLATNDHGGTIHAVPMWFAPQEGSILLATSAKSRKVQNLEIDSRATLVVHDSRPGFEVCGASIVGRAEIVRGLEARPLVARVHRRYVDESDLPKEARGFLESDDVALRLRPQSAMTWDERGSDASAALRAAGGALPLVSTDPRP